ncbi:Rad21/Rec8-like protein [Parasponia andersonii]|uniref:Rad21/Rec8-like protein n=1 Tax=Parasponia andersonii TaxID=3476 RepID=A0A2P5B936_PARAD|nr:Rad21/Rec8-like protein [Parasponia andersonii]
MLYRESQKSLVSKKGPLGAIRVAAYFFKRLKKPQVQQTDISSSVDKILHDEMQVVTYRVLGYLLLGIVRIYSKKVEYLFDDCQEVLIGINDFMVHAKKDMPADVQHTPCFSITLPESFELDAFNLEILDDTTEGNVLPQEKITLKDSASEYAGIRQYALDMYLSEEIASSYNSCFADYTPVEDIISSFRMDMHLRKSHKMDSFTANVEKLQEHRFSQEECTDLEMFYAAEEEPQNAVKPCEEDCREKMKDPETSSSLDTMHGEASTGKVRQVGENGVNLVTSCSIEGDSGVNIASSSRNAMHGDASTGMLQELGENDVNLVRSCGIEEDHGMGIASSSKDAMEGEANTEKLQDCGENGMNLVKSGGIDGEPGDRVEPHGEDLQINGEQIMVSETDQPESETCQVIRQELSPGNLQAEMEKLRDSPYSISGSKEPQEPVETFAEENHDDGEQTLPKTPESIKSQAMGEDNSIATKFVETSKIKVPEASGSAMPQYMLIPTPAVKERARTTRKRKCVIDDMIVLPNAVLKKFINDASDLVSKRRKVVHSASVWKAKASRILHHDFFEPLLPCVSSELRSLFSEKKLKILEFANSVEPPKELDISEIPTVGISDSERIGIAPETPVGPPKELDNSEIPTVGISDTKKIGIAPETPVGPPKALNISEIATVGISDLEKIGIAPETPAQRATLTKSLESPRSPGTPNYDRVRREPLTNSFGSPLRPETPNYDREGPELFEGVWKEPSPLGDQELDLNPIDEGLKTACVTVFCPGNPAERGDELAVNLSQVAKGRTKKESARFFYEILVLNTKGYVDVKQDDAYGDILVQKLQTWTKLVELMMVDSN